MASKEPVLAENADAPNAAEQRLLHSALKLFAEKGYEATSIREIIEAAGVTRPVLYYYFVNKEDLFSQLVERCFADMAERFNGIAQSGGTCRDQLVAFMAAGFDYVEHSPETIRLILHIFFSPPGQGPKIDKNYLWYEYRFKPVLDVMRRGIESGELGAGDADTLAWVFSGIMDMHVMTKTNLPDAPLTAELAEGLVDLFLEGAISSENGRAAVKSPFKL